MPAKDSKFTARIKLKPLQWDKLSGLAFKDTIWAREMERRELDEAMFGKVFDNEGIFDQMEDMFSAKIFEPKPKCKSHDTRCRACSTHSLHNHSETQDRRDQTDICAWSEA